MKHLIKKGSIDGTIVCIHGNSSSPKIFQSLLKTKNINHTIIALELIGHSTADQSLSVDKFLSENQCEALIAAINSIDDDIFLIGNSLGGHLAIEIANAVNRLKGLMIFGTPPVKKPINFEDAFNVVPALNTFLTKNPTELDIENAAKVAVFNSEYAQPIVDDFKLANPLVRAALTIDLTNNSWSDQRTIFLNLNIPKFIVAGKQDATVNKDYIKTLVALDSNCELIEINHCGHYPTLEQPNEFIKILKSASIKVFAL